MNKSSYLILPSEAGVYGPSTVVANAEAIRSGAETIREFSSLEFQFASWSNDAIVSAPALTTIVTTELALALSELRVTGVQFADVVVSFSPRARRLATGKEGNGDVPTFKWLKIEGQAEFGPQGELYASSGDDFCMGTNADPTYWTPREMLGDRDLFPRRALIVSSKAFDVIRNFHAPGLEYLEIIPYEAESVPGRRFRKLGSSRQAAVRNVPSALPPKLPPSNEERADKWASFDEHLTQIAASSKMNKPISEEAILRLEGELRQEERLGSGFSLPPSYKRFLSKYDGGNVQSRIKAGSEPDAKIYVSFLGIENHKGLTDTLLDFNGPESSFIDDSIETYDLFPPLVFFATDVNGNFWAFDTTERSDEGEMPVVYGDHENGSVLDQSADFLAFIEGLANQSLLWPTYSTIQS